MPASVEDFDQFARRLNKDPADEVNWEAIKADWLQQVDALQAQVRGFLAPQVQSGLVQISSKPVQLYEEKLGSYQASGLMIKIGLRSVELNPIGAIIFGAMGRADLSGFGGTSKLVLVSKDATASRIVVVPSHRRESDGAAEEKLRDFPSRLDCVWKLSTPPPRIMLSELTRDTFLSTLMKVADA